MSFIDGINIHGDPIPADKDSAQAIVDALADEISKPYPLLRGAFHASQMKGLCAREAAFSEKFVDAGAIWSGQVSARRKLTYDIGHAVHEWVQERYLNMIPGWVVEDIEKHLMLKVGDVSMSGSVDAFLSNDSSDIIGVEIKTIKLDAFESLTKAKIDHRHQCCMYKWMIQEGKFSSLSNKFLKFMVMYVPKQEPKEGSPFKAFWVDDDVEYKKFRDLAESQLLSVDHWLKARKAGVEDHPYPMMGCSNSESYRARNCFFRPVCFGSFSFDDFREKVKHEVIESKEDLQWMENLPFWGWTLA